MLIDQHGIDPPLRLGVILQNLGNGDLGVGEPEIAARDFFCGLRILCGLLRDRAAPHQGLPAGVDIFLLVVGHIGTITLRLRLQRIGRGLTDDGFAFHQFGALRVVVELCEQGAGFHKVVLIGADRPDLSGQVKPNLRRNLGLHGPDPEDPHFHIRLWCQDRQRDLARAEPVDRARAYSEGDDRQYCNLNPDSHVLGC